jgi:hypothetical protein
MPMDRWSAETETKSIQEVNAWSPYLLAKFLSLSFSLSLLILISELNFCSENKGARIFEKKEIEKEKIIIK